jgi:hypothetical protein
VPKTLKTRDSGTKQVHENRQTFFEDTDLLVPEKMGHINTRQVWQVGPFSRTKPVACKFVGSLSPADIFSFLVPTLYQECSAE